MFGACSYRYSSLSVYLGRTNCRNLLRSITTCARTRTQPLRTITSPDDPIRRLPPQYLRAMDPNNFNKDTFQRVDVAIDKQNGKVLPRKSGTKHEHTMQSCVLEAESRYHVRWDDGIEAEYSASSIRETFNRWMRQEGVIDLVDRQLWRDMDESKVRASSSLCVPFDEALTPTGMSTALRALYQYGFVLVTDTPISDTGEGVSALAAALSGGSIKEDPSYSLVVDYHSGGSSIVLPDGTDGPLRTLYGSFWSTAASAQAEGASVADSAYTNDALPLHTDMTYYRDPPGLQIFTMVNPAKYGGKSIIADGFAVADRLRTIDPSCFDILSTLERTYRCVDKATGWHLEATGPIISTKNGSVIAIRHNDLDRLPDLPPPGMSITETSDFYESLAVAHRQWDELLNSDEFRLVMALEPGDTLIVANQRCFHARHSFEASSTSPRTVMGCYVSQDELNSRFRMEGFRVD